ncbi:MAG: hypothetical protein M1114_04150 [Candidatus Dependentiae bacterium]|nr:hypothetical protein [Candidatus Dependentiae bacterium]
MNIKHIITLATLVIYTSAHPFEIKFETNKEERSGDYYVAHLLTDAAAFISMSALVHAISGYTRHPRDIFNFMVRRLESPSRSNRYLREPGFLTRDLPTTLSTLAALFVIYKTPQWTDKHLLEKKTERSTKKNIAVFLSRLLIPYPFGTLTGEYFTR